jgi:tetratricopeptide (TPR) repeat protein
MRTSLNLRRVGRMGCIGALAAACWVGAPVAATAAEPSTPHTVNDPHYGDTLFHFYQERYFSSVTGLMVSQHFDRVSRHADEAEVLRGGLLLSYGMHREAGQIFAQLIEKGAAPAVRDRAWYYLAKIRYQRGFLAEAESAITRIEARLPSELEEDRGLLHAQLLMARGDFAGAVALLGPLTQNPGAGLYARFNLGVALLRSGDGVKGSAMLDEFGRLQGTEAVATEEARSLRDKANVALGFWALQDNRPEQARIYLARVRLASLQANKALLGFGWAAVTLKQPLQALKPWTELATRDASDAAVLEARIAVPYALAELGAHGQALDRYNEAIGAFEQEGGKLDESVTAIRAGKLLVGLLERNPGDEMGWFWSIRELPQMPHASHLTQVLAQHEFQEAFKNFRDLQFLGKNLQHWQDNLGVFGDMLATRRQAYAERLPKIRAQAGETGLGVLAQRRELLASELTRAEAEPGGLPFADAKQRDLLDRLDRMNTTLRQTSESSEVQADMAAARERARRVAGALTWQLAQQHPERLWAGKKDLRSIDSGLAEAHRRDATLAQAQRDEPTRFEVFAQRVAALGPRIQALIPRVAALSTEQQGVVQELAVAELARQKERLAVYTVQARFAVAQLYDRANADGNANRSVNVGATRKEDHAVKP